MRVPADWPTWNTFLHFSRVFFFSPHSFFFFSGFWNPQVNTYWGLFTIVVMVVRVGANSAGWRRLLLADCLSSGLFVQLIQCEYVRAHVLPACLYLQYLSSVVSLHEKGALLAEFTLLRVCVLYLMWFGCSEVGLFENFPTTGCQAKEWSGERQPLLLVKHRGCNCVFACRWVCKVKKEKDNAKGESLRESMI